MLVPDSLANSYVIPSNSTSSVTAYAPSRKELSEDSTFTPGALTLGFKRPSSVGPWDEK